MGTSTWQTGFDLKQVAMSFPEFGAAIGKGKRLANSAFHGKTVLSGVCNLDWQYPSLCRCHLKATTDMQE
jgi:hypothetical protein